MNPDFADGYYELAVLLMNKEAKKAIANSKLYKEERLKNSRKNKNQRVTK